MRTAMLFFTISAWRQVERAGKNARKGLLRIKTILETNIIHLLALAETTMDFAARDPARAGEYIALGFEAMWRALTREEQ